MAKQNYARLTTPRGVFIYPRLTEADTKFVKPDGEYHTKFALVEGEKLTTGFVTELEAVLDAYIDDNPEELTKAKLKKAGRADLYEEECDDEGNETGRLIFKFKLKAKVVTKTKSWDQKPRLFDAGDAANDVQPQPIPDGTINPWTGSEGKCNLELFPYYMESTKQFGLSLRLVGAQILKLVEGGSGASADDMGFGAEDGGYTSDTSAAANGFGEEETGGSDGEDDDEF